MDCKFKHKCLLANTESCSNDCFAYVVLHGLNGKTGYWGSRRVPKKYDNCFMDNLPIEEENPKPYEVIKKYCSNIKEFVLDKGMGLYLFSIPDPTNRLGTGTGKTTSAITILNEFLVERVRDFVKEDFTFKDNPTMFIKLSELQNIYNSMFRGNLEVQKINTNKYYTLTERMKKVELLVVDDVGVRDLTEAFLNELYDIIDTRVVEDRATIYTSNYPLPKLREILGDRIVSRIEGQCYPVGFKGKDYRKGGLFR